MTMHGHPGREAGVSMIAIVSGILTVAVFVGIATPFVLRHFAEQRRAEMAASCERTLHALMDAEAAYKKEHGKFWRPEGGGENITREAAKSVLGVEIPQESDCRFEVYPPDLVADPAVRVGAHGSGEFPDLTIECVHDALSAVRTCEKPEAEKPTIW